MTLEETKKLFNDCFCLYPVRPTPAHIQRWYQIFREFPYDMIYAAVTYYQKYDQKDNFMPMPSVIMEIIQKRIVKADPAAEIQKAYTDFDDFFRMCEGSKKEDRQRYEALPEMVKKLYTLDYLESIQRNYQNQAAGLKKEFEKKAADYIETRNRELLHAGKYDEIRNSSAAIRTDESEIIAFIVSDPLQGMGKKSVNGTQYRFLWEDPCKVVIPVYRIHPSKLAELNRINE